MASIHFTLLLLPFLCFISSSATTTITLDLIHRDSPLSPLYNPNDTAFDRLHAAVLRSLSRRDHHRLCHAPRNIDHFQTDILPSGGEYFMNLSIGTPPFHVFAIADTGSDLIWVQSKPCYQCYKQKDPIFDPSKSSTLHRVQCGTHPCNSLDDDARSCSKDGTNTCAYAYSYGDHSYTTGYLATDTFTVGPSSTPIKNVAFGCGMRNGGTFDESGSGIVGLGGGSLSFVNQLGPKIGGKFSYCLVPLRTQQSTESATSRIVFGDDPSLNDVASVVSTPLVSKSHATYYYLTLEAITVGRRKMRYAKTTPSYVTSGASRLNDDDVAAGREKKVVEEGNIIVDSGTTLTFLDSEFYSGLEAALVEEIKLERASDPRNMFSLCFKSGKTGEVRLPVLKVHFGGGAELELKPANTFVEADEELLCFTMVPTKDVGIFGNLAQMDFVVGYDLEKRTVSFLPADCSKHN